MHEWMKTVQKLFLKKNYFFNYDIFKFWLNYSFNDLMKLFGKWVFCLHSCVDVLKQDVWVGRWHKKSASGPLLHLIHHITFTESVSAHMKC